MATVITTLAQLQSACANGGEYELGADISGVAVTVASGKTLYLDLKTYDLIGTGSDNVIRVFGQLTIDGTSGRITGGHSDRLDGGGVYVSSGGEFTMSGGTITGNVCEESRHTEGYGGGVRLDGGIFTMSGGTITGNSADFGGGVHCNGGTFKVSGNPVIKDNVGGDISLYNNIGPVFTISGNISTDADIRILYPTPALGGTICANHDNYTGVNRIISADGTLMGGMSGANVVWVPYEEPPEPVAITLPVNVNGVWKDAVPKVYANGGWHDVIGIWANVNGDWKKVA